MKWLDKDQVLIQGIDRPLGKYYAPRLKAQGTTLVAGVASGHGGEIIEEIPIFDLVAEAVAELGEIKTSLILVPPHQVLDASLEAMEAGIPQLIIVTPGVPPLDMVELLKIASARGTLILGPGSYGVIIPDYLWVGICEPDFYQAGTIGLITRGDRIGDEVAKILTEAGYGQSMAVNLGTDGIIGSNLSQWLQVFEEDENTEAILLVSQVGGKAEIETAKYIAQAIEKPVIAYIVGLNSPIESNFGDTETIISNQLSYSLSVKNTRKDGLHSFLEAGVTVVEKLADLPTSLRKVLS
jgi:succinyl-CoA synthetase alpha subunit